MNTHDILRDAASRPGIEAAVAVKGLSPEALNAHPGGHPNSIAWLLWHAGRQMDMQLSTLNGQPQVWETQGFRERFNLGELGDTMGYGHTAEQAHSSWLKILPCWWSTLWRPARRSPTTRRR